MTDDLPLPQLELPLIIRPTAHGDAWLVTTGKPRPRANWIRLSAAAKILGRERRTVLRYVEDGLLESRRLRPYREDKGRSGMVEVSTRSVEAMLETSVVAANEMNDEG